MSDFVGGNWEIAELLAVAWNPEMAERFPNASHASCRQEMQAGEYGWKPFDPPCCHGWHCNRCGSPTNSYGHHDCPDRPAL